MATVTLIFTLLSCNAYNLSDKLENPAGITGSASSYADAIWLYSSTGAQNGNLQGGFGSARAGADNICAVSRNFANPCSTVRALISLGPSDQMVDMATNYGVPTNKPIKSITGAVIDSDWANFAAENIQSSLEDAGVMPVGTSWWSFSASNATYDGTNNCQNGTKGDNTVGGAVGSSTATGTWIYFGTPPLCDATNYLLCICY